MNQRPSVLIIYTGGTIGMIKDEKTNVLIPFNFENLLKYIPLLKNFNADIQSLSFEKPIDSSDINPEVWTKLVVMIRDNFEKYDGFVILLGSDTMAYTASALSFMFENLSKPIILTGSQLPIGLLRTDGRENLIVALEIASAKKDGKPLVPEVCIYFENHLFRGNRSHKFNAEHFKAFISPNHPPLAEVGVHIKYNTHTIIQPRINFLIVHPNLNNNIAILKLFPGINKNFVEAVLNTNGLQALILETYGSGNAPTDPWLIDCFKKAITKGIIILNITQCEGGVVEMGKYETSRELSEIGVVGGVDMTTEAAITKLMYLLGENFSSAEIKKLLPISLRGELTEQINAGQV